MFGFYPIIVRFWSGYGYLSRSYQFKCVWIDQNAVHRFDQAVHLYIKRHQHLFKIMSLTKLKSSQIKIASDWNQNS